MAAIKMEKFQASLLVLCFCCFSLAFAIDSTGMSIHRYNKWKTERQCQSFLFYTSDDPFPPSPRYILTYQHRAHKTIETHCYS